MKSKAIVVFDSGFGGISVLKRLVDAMPNEDYLYYGDSANAPYGPRSTQEVQSLTLCAIEKAKQECDPKAIVIACNTATAATRELLQKTYPEIPVIGILPAVEAAAAAQKHPRILVLATAGTLASQAYAEILARIGGSAEVISVAAPEIVVYVEGGMRERNVLLQCLRKSLEPHVCSRFDSVVLGCTHFPFAADVIEEALGYPVTFFDGSILVASQTREILQNQDTRSTQTHSGSIRVINSANLQENIGFTWKLLSSPLKVK